MIQLKDRITKPNGEIGCWVWNGALSHDGYGRFGRHINGERYVHRIMYEYYFGTIPDGLTIDHLCRVRNCCNPFHLEVVTLTENISRGNYGWHGQKTHCPRGHEYNVDNTYFNKRNERYCRACGSMHQRAYKARKKAEAN
jgi:hypothetical protein